MTPVPRLDPFGQRGFQCAHLTPPLLSCTRVLRRRSSCGAGHPFPFPSSFVRPSPMKVGLYRYWHSYTGVLVKTSHWFYSLTSFILFIMVLSFLQMGEPLSCTPLIVYCRFPNNTPLVRVSRDLGVNKCVPSPFCKFDVGALDFFVSLALAYELFPQKSNFRRWVKDCFTFFLGVPTFPPFLITP